MPSYFFHLRSDVDEALDTEGVNLPDVEAVKRAGIEAARDVMAGDLREGLLDLRYRIDVENSSGVLVFTLNFEHAVHVISATR